MASLAIAAESLQDLETALTCWELAYERAHELGAVADETQALRGRATILLLRGRVRDAVADAEYAARMAGDSQIPPRRGDRPRHPRPCLRPARRRRGRTARDP
ncbi:hypothetical protein [Curtobacterium sp. MCPF17_052]|uniref:hypothetical protein n=1 Tax=Curtobacterium sp. MCPF17_052 TaxID=2175655 RepID=UPI0024DF6FBB|nr:hypothetical protein [Curtobacterium sp. MCPF17_052]WIB12488.1 hypothetical protein DEJ36_17935 [Curtobacterium sp. MCPF17_052]